MGKSKKAKPKKGSSASLSAQGEDTKGDLKVKMAVKTDDESESEEESPVLNSSGSKTKSKIASKDAITKQKSALKGKSSSKNVKEVISVTKSGKRKHSSERSELEEVQKPIQSTSKKLKTEIKSEKEDDEDEDDSSSSRKVWELLSQRQTVPIDSSSMSSAGAEKKKEKDKKKKKKEKDKKKKLFSSKSDKNRFLNVRRSSDEDPDGWIPEKAPEKKTKLEGGIEYEIITPFDKSLGYEKINLPRKEISIEMSSGDSRMHFKEKKHKSKSRSKSNKKKKQEKRMRKMMQLQRKADKETLTREQIIKIQQRLMTQGMKSPTNFGNDLELNFSSHGEDLISQLTSSSENFDPTSFFLESSAEEGLEKQHGEKKELKKPEKVKVEPKSLKDLKKKKPAISAYMLWCKANRPKIARENPNYKFADISRRQGELWQALPEKEKCKWRHQARSQMMKHKNVPSLSRLKRHTRTPPGRLKKTYRVPPPHTDPIDVAAHLRLLGDSLSGVGRSLASHAGGQAEVHGSMSVLLDSMLSAIAPLLCLTSQVEELKVIPKKTQASMLENISYIMPGL